MQAFSTVRYLVLQDWQRYIDIRFKLMVVIVQSNIHGNSAYTPFFSALTDIEPRLHGVKDEIYPEGTHLVVCVNFLSSSSQSKIT